MEQKQAKNDQQATDAALAALAAAGNAFALGQLWEVNKGFIRRQLWQWYEKNKPVADNAGLSFEDLVQEGYFAVDYAAKHYSAEQGNFTTYLSYALLKQIRTATCGDLQRRTGQFHNVSELRTVEADSHRHLWRAHTGCHHR